MPHNLFPPAMQRTEHTIIKAPIMTIRSICMVPATTSKANPSKTSQLRMTLTKVASEERRPQISRKYPLMPSRARTVIWSKTRPDMEVSLKMTKSSSKMREVMMLKGMPTKPTMAQDRTGSTDFNGPDEIKLFPALVMA